MELPRSARATRGQRLSKLVDDEAEADNVFWGQEAFQEEKVDQEYEAEVEIADEFDSDFDAEEPDSDEGEAQEEKEVKKKKKLPYKGADKKKKSVSFLLGSVAIPRIDKSSSKKKPYRPKPPKEAPPEGGDEENEERTIRKSTRTAVVSKQAARDARRQTLPKPVKRKKGEERKLSQEEMLLEAAQTEVLNLQSLEKMLAREEEVKKKAIIQKTVYTGPQVRFISKNGHNVIEFTKTNTFPSSINAKAKPYPEQALCVVTGLPAKYKDPKTGFAYATKEAFKVLRERCVNKFDKPGAEEIHQRKRTKVETERANGSGVARLRFKRSLSGKESPSPMTSPQQQVSNPQTLVQVVKAVSKAPCPVPLVFEPANEADFPLEDLDVKFAHTYDSATQSWRFETDEAVILDGHVMETLCRRSEPRELHTDFSLFDESSYKI